MHFCRGFVSTWQASTFLEALSAYLAGASMPVLVLAVLCLLGALAARLLRYAVKGRGGMNDETDDKQQGKRIAAGVAGGVLVLGLLLAADAAYGDPLSRAWAESRAVQYAEELYPGQTFIVTASYDGSRFEYGAFVQSEQSPDTRFEGENLVLAVYHRRRRRG